MSFMLCLEDSAGEDKTIEIDPSDTFATFTEKASTILGYELQLSNLVQGEEVTLADNMYDFYNKRNVEEAPKEPAAVPIQEQDKTQAEDQHISEERGEVAYVLEDGTQIYTSQLVNDVNVNLDVKNIDNVSFIVLGNDAKEGNASMQLLNESNVNWNDGVKFVDDGYNIVFGESVEHIEVVGKQNCDNFDDSNNVQGDNGFELLDHVEQSDNLMKNNDFIVDNDQNTIVLNAVEANHDDLFNGVQKDGSFDVKNVVLDANVAVDSVNVCTVDKASEKMSIMNDCLSENKQNALKIIEIRNRIPKLMGVGKKNHSKVGILRKILRNKEKLLQEEEELGTIRLEGMLKCHDVTEEQKIFNENYINVLSDFEKDFPRSLCVVCDATLNSCEERYYMFNGDDVKRMLESVVVKRDDLLSKIVCETCLFKDYIKTKIVSKILNPDTYLVVYKQHQMIFKKKNILSRVPEDIPLKKDEIFVRKYGNKNKMKVVNGNDGVKAFSDRNKWQRQSVLGGNNEETSERWLDEDSGFVISSPRKINLQDDTKSDAVRRLSDSDSDNGVWILQAGDSKTERPFEQSTIQAWLKEESRRKLTTEYLNKDFIKTKQSSVTLATKDDSIICKEAISALNKVMLSDSVVNKESFDKSKLLSAVNSLGMLKKCFNVNNNDSGNCSTVKDVFEVNNSPAVWLKNEVGDNSIASWLEGEISFADGDLEANWKEVQGNGKETEKMTIAKFPLGPRAFQCDACRKRYSSADRLQKHHCNGGAPSGPAGDYSCPLCPATFHTKVRLQFHNRFLHAGPQSLRCSLCPKLAFPTESALYDHVHFSHNTSREYPCLEPGCGKAFKLKAALTTHSRSHANERSHRCEVCGKQFLDRQTLGEHSITHLEVKPFQCHVCMKFLNRRSRLKMHLLTHHSEPACGKVISCKGCDEGFKDAKTAMNHLNEFGQCPDTRDVEYLQEEAPEDSQVVDGVGEWAVKSIQTREVDQVYRCEFCERVYCVADSLNLHRACHADNDNPYTCHVCSATFSSYSRCTTHKTTHGYFRGQNGSKPVPQEAFPVVKHFLCEVCGRAYLHWTYLQVHRRQKHSDNVHMYTCKECGDEFPTSWGIAYHRKKVHSQKNGATGPEDELKQQEKVTVSCADCDFTTKNKGHLLVHRKLEHSGNSTKQALFACEQCGKKYITKVGLKGHMKSHQDPESAGSHTCEICGKNFAHAAGLITHGRRVHLKETRFSCSMCDKAFYSSCDLRSHARRHTGERPFRCSVCGHAFRTKGMRNEHARVHTGERPFPCDICGLTFRRSYAMKSHRLTHAVQRNKTENSTVVLLPAEDDSTAEQSTAVDIVIYDESGEPSSSAYVDIVDEGDIGSAGVDFVIQDDVVFLDTEDMASDRDEQQPDVEEQKEHSKSPDDGSRFEELFLTVPDD